MSSKEKLEEAKKFVSDNLEECCRELLEWHDVGVLKDGKIRELANLCSFADYMKFNVAENLVKRAALEHICDLKKEI